MPCGYGAAVRARRFCLGQRLVHGILKIAHQADAVLCQLKILIVRKRRRRQLRHHIKLIRKIGKRLRQRLGKRLYQPDGLPAGLLGKARQRIQPIAVLRKPHRHHRHIQARRPEFGQLRQRILQGLPVVDAGAKHDLHMEINAALL